MEIISDFQSPLDPKLTVGNVINVMEKVTEDKRRRVWEKVLGIDGKVDEIYSGHSSEKEKTHALSDIYVNCHPEPSWEYLTSVLYEEEEMTAVDQARPFLPPKGKLVLLTASKLGNNVMTLYSVPDAYYWRPK